MSSDNIIPRFTPGWRPVGVGQVWTMRCGKCNQSMPNLGRKKMRVKGLWVMVGKCCQPAAEPLKAAA